MSAGEPDLLNFLIGCFGMLFPQQRMKAVALVIEREGVVGVLDLRTEFLIWKFKTIFLATRNSFLSAGLK